MSALAVDFDCHGADSLDLSGSVLHACYDSIRLGLGPVPEPRPAQSDPLGVSDQSRRMTQCIM